VLVALLLLPAADVANDLLAQLPGLQEVLRERRLLVAVALNLDTTLSPGSRVGYVLLLTLISAVSKELAFRGWILNGLRQRLRPWTAILISSLLFAAFHMNVFVLLPASLLGVVLGVLAVRSGSLVPGIVLHVGCYVLLIYGAEPTVLPLGLGELTPALRVALAVAGVLLAVFALWWLNWKRAGLRPLQALVRVPLGPDSGTNGALGVAEQPRELGKTPAP
jgi:membrane protease YdiL (CAAX protease family)